jgi:hypothetical protein
LSVVFGPRGRGDAYRLSMWPWDFLFVIGEGLGWILDWYIWWLIFRRICGGVQAFRVWIDKGGQVQRTLNVLQPIVNHTHHHSNFATYYVSLVPSVLIISSEFYIWSLDIVWGKDTSWKAQRII